MLNNNCHVYEEKFFELLNAEKLPIQKTIVLKMSFVDGSQNAHSILVFQWSVQEVFSAVWGLLVKVIESIVFCENGEAHFYWDYSG